ncbi:hypothetical protein GCM10009838_00600 [Catenulispora subtropica]|uniref:Uncharacterized protein n=1 Tax=Catenulispora subtropica TaxID=450798 RepID=A0ABN2QC70_9ACTN
MDVERSVLVGAYSTGAGDVGFTVAALPAGVSVDAALSVAARLDALSRALWRCYTHPAAAAGDDMTDDSEGWRRQSEREEFDRVLEAVEKPNLPDAGGGIIVEYSVVAESAHRLGRAVHAIGDQAFAAAVRAQAAAELAAVEQAELGDLSGRAVQAVMLSRTSASPVQVAAADALLREELLGGAQLFTAVDPTSAAVAAAHWLHAAATVAAAASGYEVTQVVVAADDIEEVPVATPSMVLAMMQAGASPHDAVTALIGEAVDIAEGKIPNLPGLLDALTEATENAEQQGDDDEELLRTLLSEIRTTPLDTSRPAPDLLEDLLTGIYACMLLYREYESELDDEETIQAFDLAEVDDVVGAVLAEEDSAAAAGDENEDEDEDENGEEPDWPELASPRFLAAVRAQAAATADRLV